VDLRRRDIFLKIEPLVGLYSPLSPVPCSRRYGRDCMYNQGHELGRVSREEIFASSVDALVYHEYRDPHYQLPERRKLIRADANEPPWEARVPGCVLYAEPGERLYIHVLNADADDCHSLHVHGVRYGSDSDGAWPFGVADRDGRRSDEIRPGERWTYVFDATQETIGAWAFHDHVRRVQQNVARGLFGALIVRDPRAPCADHEVPVFVHQMAGSARGSQFESGILQPDGQSPASRFPHQFGSEEEVCHYQCGIHGPSMSGTVRVVAGGPMNRAVTARDNFFDPQEATVAPGGTVTWTNQGRNPHIVLATGGGAATYCLNGRAYVGNTPTILTEPGQRLRWYVLNLDLGEVWHNFHPHSARWQLPAPPGGAADVHSVSPAESFVADTVAPPALRLPCALEELQCEPPPHACRVRIRGDFLFHCHLEAHMMTGLAGLVRSRQWLWATEEALVRTRLALPYDDDAACPHVDLARCAPRDQHPHHDEAPVRRSNPATVMAAMPAPGGGMGPPAVDVRQAARDGAWELLACDSQVLAVHAALLHTGKVAFIAGSGNTRANVPIRNFRSVIWDYQNGGFKTLFTPTDVFCCGHAFLPDGRLLVAGGTEEYAQDAPRRGFRGAKDAYLLDPTVEEFVRVGSMQDGRWYPTLVAQPDGSIVAISGLRFDLRADGTSQFNPLIERYSYEAGWQQLGGETEFPLYPHVFLLEDSTMWYSGGYVFGSLGRLPGRLRLPPAFAPITTPRPVNFLLDQRDQSSSVLLPPAQDQRIMLIGGGDPAIDSVDIIDLRAPNPAYAAAAPLNKARMHLNAVLLPDRTVFVCGGNARGEDVPTAVLEGEIYDPEQDRWRLVAAAQVPRLYHSTALLLPDGRVITAGSNPERAFGGGELRLELYHPPYLFRGRRPSIQDAPGEIHYGETFEVHTPQARNVRWVELVRPMATTHSCDVEQRLVDLRHHRQGLCHMVVRVPNDAALAPPGWYMLFIVDEDRIPSTARWVHLGPRPQPPPSAPTRITEESLPARRFLPDIERSAGRRRPTRSRSGDARDKGPRG
jgi:FtsP/CotA-like multicopper oxidase with cupredoxin domain